MYFFPTKGQIVSSDFARASKFIHEYTSYINLRVLGETLQCRQDFCDNIVHFKELAYRLELGTSDTPDLCFEIIEVFRIKWKEKCPKKLLIEDFCEASDSRDKLISNSPSELIGD